MTTITTSAPPRFRLELPRRCAVGYVERVWDGRPLPAVDASLDGAWTLCDLRLTPAWRVAEDAGGLTCGTCRRAWEGAGR